MSAPFVVWLSVGLVSTLAVIAVAIGLVRHLFLLGRTLRRFQEDVSAVAQEIGRESELASRRARRSSERPFGRR